MCGISGFITPRHRDRTSLEMVARSMAATVVHRGPDDSDVWTDPAAGVALGHQRLSILDLSPLGRQPMSSATGRYVTTLNGEIYNFAELRSELVSRGHSFRSRSDTEVLLASVEEWGVLEASRRFEGMFAFALWDRTQRRLCLVRDRIGEKPLYYGWIADSFLFASELKAMRAHPQWQGEVDRDALTLYFRFNCIPAPYSIYKGIHKLLPGTVLEIDPSQNRVNPDPIAYWSALDVAERGRADPLRGGDGAATDELEAVLKHAVSRQMVADVPLGAFLSGGVDSSTVVALMQTQSARPVKTFTIGFNEMPHNEAVHAKAVAGHLGTDHTELYVTSKEAMGVIPCLPQMYDEPFADSSQIPTHLVSRLARSAVTVALSGDGGDELFGGYVRHVLAPRVWRGAQRLPRPLREMAARGLDGASPWWGGVLESISGVLPQATLQTRLTEKAGKVARVLRSKHPQAAYAALVSVWLTPEELVIGGSEPETLGRTGGKWPELGTFEQQMMYMDLVTYLPTDILTKVDRAAMAVSLETRVPFLDRRVIEFAWRVPDEMKFRKGVGKWLLRQVLYRHVPPALIERPKMGFAVPIGEWLRGPLREWAEDLLDERRLRQEGYLVPAPIRHLWQRHQAGKEDGQFALWGVLMFQAWLAGAREDASARLVRVA
jgi:asparagine synthase (glutamine-hydrolysing)